MINYHETDRADCLSCIREPGVRKFRQFPRPLFHESKVQYNIPHDSDFHISARDATWYCEDKGLGPGFLEDIQRVGGLARGMLYTWTTNKLSEKTRHVYDRLGQIKGFYEEALRSIQAISQGENSKDPVPRVILNSLSDDAKS